MSNRYIFREANERERMRNTPHKARFIHVCSCLMFDVSLHCVVLLQINCSSKLARLCNALHRAHSVVICQAKQEWNHNLAAFVLHNKLRSTLTIDHIRARCVFIRTTSPSSAFGHLFDSCVHQHSLLPPLHNDKIHHRSLNFTHPWLWPE